MQRHMPLRQFCLQRIHYRKALRAIKLVVGFGIDVSTLCIFEMSHKLLNKTVQISEQKYYVFGERKGSVMKQSNCLQ